MLDDCQLLEVEVETTHPVNAEGRFTRLRSAQLFLGQTREGNVRRFGHDVPDRVVDQLNETIDREPVVTDLRAGLSYLEEYRRILAQWKPVQRVSRGFGYRYPEGLRRYQGTVRVARGNVHLGEKTFPWLLEEWEACQPCIAAIEDGQFVSICHSPHTSAIAHIAGVNTLAGYRRRGHATAVAVEWGVAVRQVGRIPIYSTGFDNVASQGVARKAGLVLYNADHHFR